jgi:hypothetical protein
MKLILIYWRDVTRDKLSPRGDMNRPKGRGIIPN